MESPGHYYRTKPMPFVRHSSQLSFHYKGRSPKVQDVGRELGVQYIVEGSVRKVGDRIRVTAQLVEAQGGTHLWAERYDRELTDMFVVQMKSWLIAATAPANRTCPCQRAMRTPRKSRSV
jgi:TolB-like protein